MTDNQKAHEVANGDAGGGTGREIVSAAVEVGNSKPFNALLGPAFTHLGGYLGKRAKDWVDSLEERRAKNVRDHIERVKGTEKIPEEERDRSEHEMLLLLQWVDEAQKVNPEAEADLAALWQGILADIYRNEGDSDELMAALKLMKRSDALALLQMPRRRWIEQDVIGRSRATHFQTLGLMEPFGWRDARQREFMNYPMLAFMAVICAFSAIMLLSALPPYAAPVPASVLAGAGLMLGAMALLLGALKVISHIGNYRLTRLGQRLRNNGLKYWKPSK